MIDRNAPGGITGKRLNTRLATAFLTLALITPAAKAEDAPGSPPVATTGTGTRAGASTGANTGTNSRTSTGIGWASIAPGLEHQLDDDQKTLHEIFTKLNSADPAMGDLVLSDLTRQVNAIQQRTHATIGQIQTYDGVVNSFLKVLGDKPATNEDPSITAQRAHMLADSQSIAATLVRARLYELEARQLGTIIDSRRSHLQHAAISHRTSSPLSPHFWHDLASESPDDSAAVAGHGALSNWLFLLLGAILTLILTGLAARPIVRGLQMAGRRLVVGRSGTPGDETPNATSPDLASPDAGTAGTVATALTGLVCSVLAPVIWGIWAAATLDTCTTPDGGPIASALAGTLPVCGFILGAGLPILGKAGLRAIRDHGARRALSGMDWLLAFFMLALDVLRALETQHVLGAKLLLLLQIVFSLVAVFATLSICRSLARRADTNLLAPSVVGLATLLTVVVVVAVLLGYVSFAFSVTGWLLVVGTGIAIASLMALCWRATIEYALGTSGPLGSRLLPLGVTARLLSQVTVILTGIGNVFLLLLLFSLVQSDGDFDVSSVFARFGLLFSGLTIRGVTISLDTVLVAIGIVVAAYYAIGQTRKWLSERLFPTTRLDIGSQTSIISIFSYCCWILVGLALLSVAGLSVTSLTWVVSALSVGIGFGLQAIVQNFVSGIILLADRPVRVGDVVEIGGTRGDVKRISVRATNLGLSDGSTLIVPNSQFITGTVKNATFGGSGSTLTLSFSVPTGADPDQARSMLLEVIAKRPEVLSNPAPKVRVTAIGADAVTMALTFSLGSVRDNGAVQDGVLFDIFRRFHAENIAIATA